MTRTSITALVPWTLVALVVPALAMPALADAAPLPTATEVARKAREKGPLTLPSAAAAEVKLAGSQKAAAGLPPLTNPYPRGVRRSQQGDERRRRRPGQPLAADGDRGPARQAHRRGQRPVAWKKTARAAAAAAAVGEAVTAWGEARHRARAPQGGARGREGRARGVGLRQGAPRGEGRDRGRRGRRRGRGRALGAVQGRGRHHGLHREGTPVDRDRRAHARGP